jgi:GNAT superfamily N-acetyltransferase
MAIHIKDVSDDTLWFVSTCTHVGESVDWDRGGAARRSWIQEMLPHGLQIKVALDGDQPIGFIHLLPIEHSALNLNGHDLYVIPCMALKEAYHGQGVGRKLVEAAEDAAQATGAQGLAVVGHESEDDPAFMPADFFYHLGYQEVDYWEHAVILWKRFTEDAEPPCFAEPTWDYEPVPGKVAFDAFWHRQCLTTATEIISAREVVAEFGDRVLLREYDATDPAVRERYRIGRLLAVNGREINWLCEVTREEMRQAILEELDGCSYCGGCGEKHPAERSIRRKGERDERA